MWDLTDFSNIPMQYCVLGKSPLDVTVAWFSGTSRSMDHKSLQTFPYAEKSTDKERELFPWTFGLLLTGLQKQKYFQYYAYMMHVY